MLKSKFALSLLLFAVMTFSVISLGGDYFHSQIHKHHNEASKQECSFSQLLVKQFILLVAVFAFVFMGRQYAGFSSCQSIVSKTHFLLPSLRAPPIV